MRLVVATLEILALIVSHQDRQLSANMLLTNNPNLSVVNLFAINETNDLTFDPACFNGCGSNLTYGTIFNVYYISPPKIIPETIGTQNGTQKIGFEGQYGKVRKVNLLKNEVVRGNYSNSLWWAFYRNIIGDLE